MRNKRASESVEEESDVVVAESRGEGQKKRVRTLATTQANPAELHLAATLFGTVDEAIERRQVVVDTPLEGMDGDADTPQLGFVVDGVSGGQQGNLDGSASNASDDEGESTRDDSDEDEDEARPAWRDDDDAQETVDVSTSARLRKLRQDKDEAEIAGDDYAQRLRGQFQKRAGGATSGGATPQWAQLQGADATDEAMTQATGATASLGDILMRRGQPLLAQRQVSLPQRRLDIVRLANANKEGVSGGAVRCTEYHPHAPVLLTAGLDKTLRLFHVDGKENARLQAVHFADLPIYSAQFTPDGQRIYLSGRRPFFYAYDLVTGTASRVAGLQGHATVKSLESMYMGSNGELVFLGGDGTLVIVDERTRHWVADMKMNGSARHAAFVDEHTLVSAGTDGFAYVWDMRMRRCKHRFVDQGALKCTSLAASPRASYLAFGADSGVVNVYRTEDCLASETPEPAKAIMNLVTAATHAVFHPSEEILAVASWKKKDALKMVHLPSMTVFENWPTSQTPLHYVHSLAFSPQRASHFVVGNDRGAALTFSMSHFLQ